MSKPMNKFLKFILIASGSVLGFFVVLLAAAAIIIPMKFPPAKLKALATDALSQALNRKVSVGSVKFEILNGFEITEVKIPNREGWTAGNFVSAKEISVSYHLLPLLWGQVSLGEIRLNEPNILVENRGRAGLNFSDMAAKGPAPKAGKPAVKAPASTEKNAPAPEEKSGGLPFALTVDSINILHGKVSYLDWDGPKYEKSDLSDLNLRVKNISLTGGKTTLSLTTPFTFQKMSYVLELQGAGCYDLSAQTIKGLLIKGDVSGVGFEFSGSAKDIADNFSPDITGSASLEMIKTIGLLPKSLASMPEGLELKGPALLTFQAGGSLNEGLTLNAKAEGEGMYVRYKDLFLKESKMPMRVEFKSVKAPTYFKVSSYHAYFKDWELTGSFLYQNGASYSCELHSKSLPLKGIPGTVPRWQKAIFSGDASLDLRLSQKLGNAKSLQMDGQAVLNGIGIALPSDPHIFEDLKGVIAMKGSSVKMLGATFKAFEGTGAASLAFNLAADPVPYSYAFSLKGVSAQEAVDGWIDMAVTKDMSDYKDKLFGTLNLSYQGTGSGLSGEVMEASMAGTGEYDLIQAKLKGLGAVKTLNSISKDKSDEITINRIAGKLGMKKKVFSYTVNTTDKVGTIRAVGAIDFDGNYAPDMKVQCDLRKDYLDASALKSIMPGSLYSTMGDANGNIPIDVKFTGKVKDNHYSWDWNRALKNLGNNVVKNLGTQLFGGNKKDATAPGQKKKAPADLGSQLKGLFGK